MKPSLSIHLQAIACFAAIGWICTQITETFLGAVALWVVSPLLAFSKSAFVTSSIPFCCPPFMASEKTENSFLFSLFSFLLSLFSQRKPIYVVRAVCLDGLAEDS